MKLIPSLHLMTEYSFLKSTIKIDDLISFAIENGLKELVITDHNNMFGVAEFVNKCKKNNIKPIIGIDLDVDDYRLIILAKNYNGYKSLCKLSSLKYFDKEISLEMLDDENCFIIDHPVYGSYARKNKPLKVNNYFISTDSNLANSVETSYVRCLYKSDIDTLKLLDKLNDTNEKHGGFYPLNEEGSSDQIDQAQKIVDECNVVFPKNVSPIPKFDKTKDSKKYFKDLIVKTSKEKLGNLITKKAYIERLNEEFKIISGLGFEDYFLVIWDLVKWSKANGILIGPGRGSAAGSLISFILGITEIDPVKNDLLFERFLNPERVTMPDIDIDIQDNRREEVLMYLVNKYGKDNVGVISTFQRLGAKSSLRDVGRLMNIPNGDVLQVTKLVPNFSSLEEAYKTSTRFRAAIDKNDIYTSLYKNSLKIEGLARQLGTHAAGVVISDNPLVNSVPVVKSSEGLTQVQFSMDFLEENGLLKIDLLGLRNLTILNDIQQEIFINHNRKVALNKIPYIDEKTNKLLSSGNTNGIFQLESYGMKKTVKEIGVSSMQDLAAIISLYRPGPMQYIKDYLEVKQGKKINPVDPTYDAIVKPTMGILIYQEQIMEVAQKYAGMTFGKADILRRAIGKKKIKLMNSLKEEFISGALSKNHSKEQAEKIYKLIEKFAAYGFNKSHAFAYALLGYRMAYLKTWFPFEFYTALIKASIGSLKTLKNYIYESKEAQINIKAPNVNVSDVTVINKKPSIILPLSIIKGLGNVANLKIIEERKENGKYKDFFDFVSRARLIGISESVITSLIKSGSLSDFGNMNSLIDSLPQALRYGDMIIVKKDGIKTINKDLLSKPHLVESEENLDFEIENEKTLYGFNIAYFATMPFEKDIKIIDIKENSKKTIVARINFIKKFNDKNGQEMAKYELEDSSTTIEAFAFNSVFKFLKNTKAKTIVETTLEFKNGRYVILNDWKVING